jgi:hypothetical protein
MKHSIYNPELSALVSEAITYFSPDYIKLRKLCQQQTNAPYKNTFRFHSAFSDTQNKPTALQQLFTNPPKNTQFIPTSKNDPTALLFTQQNFLIIKINHTYQIQTIEKISTPLCNFNKHRDALSAQEFCNAVKRLHKNNTPSTEEVIQIAKLCNKRWTRKQINRILETNKYLSFENIFTEAQLLDKIYKEKISLRYIDQLQTLQLINRSHGIITLDQLILFCNKFNKPLSEHSSRLILLVMQATEAFHTNNRTHEAIQLENFALDILDNGETLLFLKNMCFSLSHNKTNHFFTKYARRASFDGAPPPSALNKHLQNDCEKLAIVLYQILYRTTDPSLIDSFVQAIPDTYRETYELIQSITHPPYNIHTSTKRFLSKQKTLQNLSNILQQNEREKESPEYISSEQSIRAAINTIRYSPNSQVARESIDKELNKNILSLDFSRTNGLTSRTPSPFFDFIQQKKPLSPKISKNIRLAVSPAPNSSSAYKKKAAQATF